MKVNNDLIHWLLKGDVSIQYQTYRDLMGEDREDLQERISKEGWGLRFLYLQKPDGHWGERFYQPKWISTHYTLLDLKNLNITPTTPQIQQIIEKILNEEKGPDGGILPIGEMKLSDVCVNGMFLNYACYFQAPETELESVVDCILHQKMKDGGFNCRSNRSGAHHSSLHTTISVMEGFNEFIRAGYAYRKNDVTNAIHSCVEFILLHHFFKSDRTGKIINKDFLKLPYPSRWKYDLLRALDCFRYAQIPWHENMFDAVEVLLAKRNKNGTWNVQAKHPGQIHFEMEKAGKPSRWNTLRALRVLEFYASSISNVYQKNLV